MIRVRYIIVVSKIIVASTKLNSILYGKKRNNICLTQVTDSVVNWNLSLMFGTFVNNIRIIGLQNL